MKKRLILILVMMLCFALPAVCVAEEQATRPAQWAVHVDEPAMKNFYKVDEHLYRGAQPDADGMKALQRRGFKEVLNLREFHSDIDIAKGTGLNLVRVSMNAARIKDEDIVAALKAIKNARGPILVHCWHGSDRTGVVTAMYRIVYQGWDKPAAIDELANGGYGYHRIYGNIVKYIEQVDVTVLKKALEVPEK